MLPDFFEIVRRITEDHSILDLEARLKPRDKKSTWLDASSGGFLAPSQHLLDIEQKDYETLRRLKRSYHGMAKLSSDILEQVRRENPLGGSMIRAFFGKHWRPLVKLDEENYRFMPVGSFGRQSCPWNCIGLDKFGYKTEGAGHAYVMEKGEEQSDLRRRYVLGRKEIQDKSAGIGDEEKKRWLRRFDRVLGVEFGGHDRFLYLTSFTVITDLTPHLIASHYFFQGDASYRTDPEKMLKVAK